MYNILSKIVVIKISILVSKFCYNKNNLYIFVITKILTINIIKIFYNIIMIQNSQCPPPSTLTNINGQQTCVYTRQPIANQNLYDKRIHEQLASCKDTPVSTCIRTSLTTAGCSQNPVVSYTRGGEMKSCLPDAFLSEGKCLFNCKNIETKWFDKPMPEFTCTGPTCSKQLCPSDTKVLNSVCYYDKNSNGILPIKEGFLCDQNVGVCLKKL